ncbi:uncharacterized protein KGF55_001128 [Candida pseudojiufengensis]|uniref:uncharacterized protein n=1 Tax=Candida pseudojiufengensis TaxID=497109 RepID=UPI0022241F9D|nr:uncharacterized protein KGF55_001128 [Candida pseudojiufengensis]KAI5965765.1 hypothetical protein KGF55_001128 [Candida pseudojiufengensis]
MASHPPGECCVSSTLHEGKPIGVHKELLGLKTYTVGESEQILIILTDIHGNELNNVLLIADEFSKAGFKVLIPDILKGDPIKDGDDLQIWLKSHTPEITNPIVEGFVSKVKNELKPKFLAGVGFCFGAKYAIINASSKSPLFDVISIMHPSFVTIEEVADLNVPITIQAAETDPIFTTELRHKSEVKLVEIKARYQIDLFSHVSHGFVVRGSPDDLIVKYSKERAIANTIAFFKNVDLINSRL